MRRCLRCSSQAVYRVDGADDGALFFCGFHAPADAVLVVELVVDFYERDGKVCASIVNRNAPSSAPAIVHGIGETREQAEERAWAALRELFGAIGKTLRTNRARIEAA